jgi:glycerol transport system ATP-binding protein
MGIVLERVSKFWKGEAYIRDVSLEVNYGDFVTLLGQTGAGKTTLLRILAGIERPDKGRVLVDGVDVTGMAVQKRSVAMVHQQFINYPSFTIYENIASPLRVAKPRIPEKEIDRKVRETATLLDLSGILNHMPEEVSGGQKQRTAIARALAKGAKLIVLDEPLANLDYKLREELRGELKRLFANRPGAIVYATPEPIDALSMATHVGFMFRGNLLQYGRTKEVYENPCCVDVGEYFCYPTMNIFPCRVVSNGDSMVLQATDQLKIDVGQLREKLTQPEYLLGIHAYALSTVHQKEDMLSIKATMMLSEVVGSDTELHLDHQGIRLVVLMTQVATFEIGEQVDVYLEPDRFFIFDKQTRRLVARTHGANGAGRT